MDDSGTDLFESYELECQELASSLQSLLTELTESGVQGPEGKGKLSRVEAELVEMDEILAQMEIETQTTTASSEVKRVLLDKMRTYKSDIARYRLELKELRAKATRSDLFSTTSASHTIIDLETNPSSSPLHAQRSQLLSATDQLSEGQRRLEDSHRIALETEGVGNGILQDLRGQRETLENTRENLYDADGSIDRASNTLNGMVRRMYQQRIATYAIIAILVLLILYVLYSKVLA